MIDKEKLQKDFVNEPKFKFCDDFTLLASAALWGAEWAEKELSEKLREWQGNALAHEERTQILSDELCKKQHSPFENQIIDENRDLRIKIAELREKQRWISVEERLPKVGALVIAKIQDNEFSTARFNGKDLVLDFNDFPVDRKITHWKEIE